jgi:iron complex transport system ATP-binding protein
MLEAHEVGYRIGDNPLLTAVTERFAPGTLSVVVGANGAGKSTFVRVLCRQLEPSTGSVSYDGRRLDTWSDAELARVRGVLSQNLEVAFPLKAWEIVLMGRYPHFTGTPTAADERACEEAMRFFDVWDWADRDYLTLSGGERQRVHFARVLSQIWYPGAGASRFLILDEPLTFLDIRYQFAFMHKLRELLTAGDLVVLGVVHDLNLAARFADRVLMLHGGRLLASGAPDDVLTPELIAQGFGVKATVLRTGDGSRTQLLFE